MSTCSVCYGKGYYLLTNGEEYENVRCDCFMKEKEGKNV